MESLERNVLLTVLSWLHAGSRVVSTHEVAQHSCRGRDATFAPL